MTKSNRILKKWDKSYFLVEQVKVAMVNTMQLNKAAAASRWLIDPSSWGLVSNVTTN
jgi:hypothetical protein